MLRTLAAWRRNGPPAWWEYLLIAVGCFGVALGFRLFTNPNGIVAGGVVGLSTVLQGAFRWDPATVQAAVNLPLLVLGWLLLGRAEGMRSLLGSVLLPVSIWATRAVPPLTHEPLIGAIFGGALIGIGLALILNSRGSVGGYSLVGRILSKRLGLPVATTLLVMDGLTIIASSWQFGPERALLGLVAAYVMRTAIDRALVGFSRAFVALVISKEHVALRELVLRDLDRGLTILSATGGYTGDDRPVLMVVLSGSEVPRLRSIVAECDPEAFVVITDATEVLGHGFVRA
jgi:uncharacterized membrane-anchored protein YitT (DUF2179 family)